MAWYRSGTVTAAAGQNVITGTGTQWANNVMGVAPGQALVVQRSDGNTLMYEILAVDSNTKIRINGNVVDALSAANYGIQTSVSNSYSALARETSAQLALYQQLLQDWQQITTGTGNITIIAPDGTEVVIPSLAQLSQDISNKVSQQQLSVIGIGLPSMTSIVNFDWQNFVFTSGANYLTAYNTWINPPVGVTYTAGTAVSIKVDNISSSQIGLTLIPLTTSNVNYHIFKIVVTGVAGSRTFTVREGWTSANPVPITGGGHGANTLAGAQSALGIVADAFSASQVANTPWINLTLVNGWTANNGRCVIRKVNGTVQLILNISGGTLNTTVSTVPSGYIPVAAVNFVPYGTSVSGSLALPRIYVNAAGDISMLNIGSNADVRLCVTYPVE